LSTPLGTNMVVYNTSGSLYHNKIMIVDALDYSSDPQIATGSFNWTLSAQNTNDENFVVIHDSIITNQFYQSLCKNLSDFGGIPCIAPLPLEWILFEGKLNKQINIVLSWSTAKEYNNDHFEIEKSIDGISFERIGFVNAKQNNSLNNYQFIDEKISDGNNYYRIKQVDDDGNFTYSKLISIYNRTEATVRIFPNPTSDYLNIQLPTNSEVVNIYSITGAKLKSNAVAGLDKVSLSIKNLQSSNYIIEILTKNNKIVKTFTKL